MTQTRDTNTLEPFSPTMQSCLYRLVIRRAAQILVHW